MRLSANPVPGRAFTLVELLVVLTVAAVLLALVLPGLARSQGQSRQAQCAANLRQLTLAELIYGTEHSDRLPSLSGGNWPWDVPPGVTDQLSKYSAQRQQFYCPANPDQNQDGLWNFGSAYRVTGYAQTFAGTILAAANVNSTVIPPQSIIGAVVLPAPAAASRVLVADVILSGSGQVNTAQKLNYQYTGIPGGYTGPPPGFTHRTSHLDINARYPAGANTGMLDGHVEWHKFSDVICRVGSFSPGFWW